MIGSPAFQDAFETAQQSIFRLETLPYYAGDPNYDRYRAGTPWQDTESKQHWVDLVRRRSMAGVAVQRVHVVTDPWSTYLRFEITWSYPPNSAAGEDIRILTTPTPWDGPDFWMFDDRHVWLMHYTVHGDLNSVEDVSTSAETVARCRSRKHDALAAATPLGIVLAAC